MYNQAEELYLTALKVLGPRETCGAASVWDLVSWELSCHLYTRAVLMQDCPGVYANVSCLFFTKLTKLDSKERLTLLHFIRCKYAVVH